MRSDERIHLRCRFERKRLGFAQRVVVTKQCEDCDEGIPARWPVQYSLHLIQPGIANGTG